MIQLCNKYTIMYIRHVCMISHLCYNKIFMHKLFIIKEPLPYPSEATELFSVYKFAKIIKT